MFLLSVLILFAPANFGHDQVIDTPQTLSIAHAPTGTQIAAGFADNSVRIYDAATGKKIRVFRGHPQNPCAVAWSHNGRILASGDESARVFLWDVKTGKRVGQFRDHKRGIQAISFNFDDTMMVTTGKDSILNVYDLKTKKLQVTIPDNDALHYGGQFVPGRNLIAVATLKEGVRFYDTWGHLRRAYTCGQGAFDVACDPSGPLLVAGGKDGDGVLWNTKTNQRVGTLKGHEDMVLHTAFAPSGGVCATSSDDRSVRLWDTKTFNQLGVLNNQSAVGSPLRFTANGAYLCAADIDDRLEFIRINPPQPAPAEVKVKKKPARRHRGRR